MKLNDETNNSEGKKCYPFPLCIDKTRQDKTRQDKTRRDETRRDETRRDEVRMCVAFARLHARDTEAGRNSSCTSAWTTLNHVENFFHFPRSARRFARGKECFSSRCWWTRLSGIRCRGYRSRHSSTAAGMLPLQNPYTKCTSAYSS